MQEKGYELMSIKGIEVTHLDICSFQERLGKPFIRLIKTYPTDLDPPKKCVISLQYFDPKKVLSHCTHELPLYGDSSIQTLIGQFGRDLQASFEGTEFEKAAIISSDLSTEWKNIVSSLISSQKMIYPCN